MKRSKLLSPDFALGKALLLARALVGILLLILRRPSARSLRLARLILLVTPTYTMVSPARLAGLYDVVRRANHLGVQGDVVECGTWNGGSAAVMASACRDDGWLDRRTFWLFDSFEGLPPPGDHDDERSRREFFEGWCRGEVAKVQAIFAALHVPPARIQVISGWFETTLRSVTSRDIAVLHVDADWHDSVALVLATLYDRVVPGGFVVFDDYGKWGGCRLAVDRFMASRHYDGLTLRRLTRESAYFRKPAAREV